jgi:hypothetical protein
MLKKGKAMIIVKLIGGLGNQLFQYALGRNLALKNNTELKLDISGFETYKLYKYGLHNFNIIENIATDKDIYEFKPKKAQFLSYVSNKISERVLPWYKQKYIIEPDFRFNSNILKIGKNAYLDGYWQSEKYFTGISSIILDEFSVKNEPDELNRELLTTINSTNSVCLHIRRGDYISNRTTLETHGVLGIDYYTRSLNSMKKMVNNPQIFIFSDDIPWARENLKINLPLHFIDNNGVEKNYEDLRLMSNCKHHIIANSSFSWWGAWLCINPDKIIFAPKQWFNDRTRDDRDIVPDLWIKI